MQLLEIGSDDEETKFLNLLQNYKNLDDYFVFVGATNLGKDHWYWMSSALKLKVDGKWFSGEPNNINEVENCMSIHIDQGVVGYNDAPCTGTAVHFVCQKVNNGIDLRFSS